MIRRFAAPLLLLAFAACTRSDPGQSTGLRPAPNAWTKPGVLRIASLGAPNTLNPVVGTSSVEIDLSMFWAGYFFNWNDRNEFVPELATEVPTQANGGISRDGLAFTYHLRPGVKWQDGQPFTAADVVFTWHAVMNPANDVATRQGYELISRIDAADPHTIVVHLRKRWAPFVATFFTMSLQPFPILPAHLLAGLHDINKADFNSRPVGTGPFIVRSWKRGGTIVFTANPHYWRGAPKLARIEYTPVPDVNTVVTELRAHEVDFEYNGDPALYPQYQNIPGTKIELTPFNDWLAILFNLKSPVAGDPAVRRALRYGTDAPGVIAKVLHGVPIAASTTQLDSSWAHDANIPPYTYDPTKAKAILDAAGWKPGPDGIRVRNGKRLSLLYVATSGSRWDVMSSTYLQNNWRQLGIETQLKYFPYNVYAASYGNDGVIQRGRFDATYFEWQGGVDPDDSALFTCAQRPPAGWNISRFCDPAVEKAEAVALDNYDRPTRTRAYALVQQAVAGQLPLMVTHFNRRIQVYNTDFTGYRPAHAVTAFWNSWEWSI